MAPSAFGIGGSKILWRASPSVRGCLLGAWVPVGAQTVTGYTPAGETAPWRSTVSTRLGMAGSRNGRSNSRRAAAPSVLCGPCPTGDILSGGYSLWFFFFFLSRSLFLKTEPFHSNRALVPRTIFSDYTTSVTRQRLSIRLSPS